MIMNSYIIFLMGTLTGIAIYKVHLNISFMILQRRVMKRLERFDEKQNERGG